MKKRERGIKKGRVRNEYPGDLFNSSFYAPLTNTIVTGRGSSTPTFTRATAAWCFDNEGKLNLNVPSGCVRFKGGRLVRNFVTGASETFNTSAWSAVVLTKQANSITSDASVAFQNLQQNVLNSYLTGHTIQFGLRVQYVSQQYVQLSFATAVMGSGQYCNFDLLNGIYNATGCAAGMVQVSPGVFDIWINPVATASASGGPIIVFTNSLTSARYEAFAGGAGKVIGLLRAWINNVSGQADQTPSEYVSVGVLSSPYHGAGVDGCKWFPTNKDGSAIPSSTLEGYFAEPQRTNNCLWGRLLNIFSTGSSSSLRWLIPAGSGSSVLTNSDFSSGLTGWSTTIGSGGSITESGGVVTFVSDGGTPTYLMQSAVLTIGKTYSATVVINSGTGTLKLVTVSEITGIGVGTTTFNFIADSATIRLSRIAGVACNLLIDSFSVKEAEIQVTTTTGLDNIDNSASRLTAAENDATITQLLTAATGTRTLSVYIKRVSGSGTISLTRNGGTGWTDITSSLVTGSWVLVQMTSDVGANPTVGIKMGTSGDVIDVDCVQDENGAWATSPILTTTAAVTRNGDVLSYTSAFDVAQGTSLCTIQSAVPVGTSIYILGSEALGRLMYLASATSRTQGTIYDGTTAESAAGLDLNTGMRKRCSRWGTDLAVCCDGGSLSPSAFDGSIGASGTLFVGCSEGGGTQISGTIRDVHIWPTPLTDAQLQQVTR